MKYLLIFFTIFISSCSSPEKKLTPEEQREQKIAAQFQGEGSSHPALVELIKSKMNDPDSFEHVQSRFIDEGGTYIIVIMKYRGKNAFGGVITKYVTAQVNFDKEVLQLMNEDRYDW